MPHFFQSFYSFFVSFVIIHNFPLLILCILLLFTRCATSNSSRHFKSPLAMGRDAFKSKHASSVSISGVIDTGVNSNCIFAAAIFFMNPYDRICQK